MVSLILMNSSLRNDAIVTHFLDLRTRKWNIVTHHPDFLSEAPRAYHAVIYVDNWLYFIGGYDGVHYYDKVCNLYNVTIM